MIPARRSGLTCTTEHLSVSISGMSGRNCRVLNWTVPEILMLCPVQAGTQTARVAGTTHIPWAVSTVMTPVAA